MQASMKLEDIGDETPVFIHAGEETLSGILGFPARDSSGLGVIVLAGGWRGTSAGRNRVMVRLCRRLMASGFHTLRFDYAGVGESTGTQKLTLADPSVEDLLGAVKWFQALAVSRRARRILLWGMDVPGRCPSDPAIERRSVVGRPCQHRRTIRTRSSYRPREIQSFGPPIFASVVPEEDVRRRSAATLSSLLSGEVAGLTSRKGGGERSTQPRRDGAKLEVRRLPWFSRGASCACAIALRNRGLHVRRFPAS